MWELSDSFFLIEFSTICTVCNIFSLWSKAQEDWPIAQKDVKNLASASNVYKKDLDKKATAIIV